MPADALDQLAGPAHGLLARVDAVLCRAGAPAGHPVWPLLRRLGALPGPAAGAVAALRAAPLCTAGRALHTLAGQYGQLPGPPPGRPTPAGAGWQGPAADAYAAHWSALSTHLAGPGADSLAGRLAATAGYLQALADWVDRARAALARTLATVMTSAQAVEVVTGAADPPVPAVARAAADIAARVLATVADMYAEADQVRVDWSGRLGELPLPRSGRSGPAPAAGAASRPPGTIDVTL